MNKLRTVFIILMLISSVGVVSAAESSGKGVGTGGGGLPNNPILDSIRNSIFDLSVSISCQPGYVYCYEQSNIYGNAQAVARIYVGEPFIDGHSLYVNYKGDATKYYVYRGISSWSDVHCNSNGCDGTAVGSNDKLLLGSAPSTSQPGVVFVMWDYDSYNGYWSWTWVGYGWFGSFNYNLQPDVTPAPTPTPTQPDITPAPTPTPTQPITPPKPVIIPPVISRLWETVMGWISDLFGLTISGGPAVNVLVNQPYSTSISLAFSPPDTNYADKTYESKYGEWLIIDGSKNLKYESGWSQELIYSPYTAIASFTPTTPGTYYLIGVIVRQNYVYANGAWTLSETVETKEAQKIIVDSGPTIKPPTTNIIAVIIAWLMSLFPGFA